MKKLLLIFVTTSLVFAQGINHKAKITINDPWIRPAAKEANSAFFFEVVNNTNKTDSIVSAEFKFAEKVELHETYKKSEDIMGMRAVKSVAIPAMTTVKFKPRDLHIMLLNLSRDIKRGQNYTIVLVFKYTGKIKVDVTVRDMPKM